MKYPLLSAIIASIFCAPVAMATPTYKLIRPVGKMVVTPTETTPIAQAKISFNETSRSFDAFTNTYIKKIFTLTNEGPNDVTGLTLAVNKGEVLSSTCGNSLPKNASCVVVAHYTYVETSDINIVLTATGKAGTNGSTTSASSTVVINHVPTMQGIQLQNASALKLTSPMGTKASTSFNVYNPNPYEINLSTPVFPAGAIGSATTCGSTLAANTSCVMQIESTPSSIGTVNSYVQFAASKLDAQSVVSPAVSIVGSDPYAGHLRFRYDFENLANLNSLVSGPGVAMAGFNGAALAKEQEGNTVLSLNGSSGLINHPSYPPRSFSGDFTIAFDVKFHNVGTVTSDSSPSNQYMFSMGGNETRLQWYKRSDVGLRFITGDLTLQKLMDPVVNKWYHVSVVRKNNVITFTWDGEVVGQVFRSGPIGSTHSMAIGNYSFGGPYGVNGVMDNVLIADYAL